MSTSPSHFVKDYVTPHKPGYPEVEEKAKRDNIHDRFDCLEALEGKGCCCYDVQNVPQEEEKVEGPSHKRPHEKVPVAVACSMNVMPCHSEKDPCESCVNYQPNQTFVSH
jgi:hypothetical protein